MFESQALNQICVQNCIREEKQKQNEAPLPYSGIFYLKSTNLCPMHLHNINGYADGESEAN